MSEKTVFFPQSKNPLTLYFRVFSGSTEFPIACSVLRALAKEDLLDKLVNRCDQFMREFQQKEALPGAVRCFERPLLSFLTDEPLIKLQLDMTHFDKKELGLLARDEDQAGLHLRYVFDPDFVARAKASNHRDANAKKIAEGILLYSRIKVPVYSFITWCRAHLPDVQKAVSLFRPSAGAEEPVPRDPEEEEEEEEDLDEDEEEVEEEEEEEEEEEMEDGIEPLPCTPPPRSPPRASVPDEEEEGKRSPPPPPKKVKAKKRNASAQQQQAGKKKKPAPEGN